MSGLLMFYIKEISRPLLEHLYGGDTSAQYVFKYQLISFKQKLDIISTFPGKIVPKLNGDTCPFSNVDIIPRE